MTNMTLHLFTLFVFVLVLNVSVSLKTKVRFRHPGLCDTTFETYRDVRG